MNNIVTLHQRPTMQPVTTNIQSLSNTTNLAKVLDSHQEKTDIFFPVRQQPLTQLTGLPDKDLSAIVREDTKS